MSPPILLFQTAKCCFTKTKVVKLHDMVIFRNLIYFTMIPLFQLFIGWLACGKPYIL